MRIPNWTRNFKWLAIPFVACVLSFMGGYFVRSAGTESDAEFDALMARIRETIGADVWVESTDASGVNPYVGNITACTPEAIFGSREAFERMFDVPLDEVEDENDPFGCARYQEPEKDSRSL